MIFPLHTALQEGEATVRVEYFPGDAKVLAPLRPALRRALRRVTVWGQFREPVAVRIYPDHAALEEAVHRYGYPQLRAWAQYDIIYLQSPATYGQFDCL